MKVLVVDDDAEFRDLACQLLQAGGYVVVGEAADGAEALRAHRRLHPDLVLLDIQLPDQDGFAVAELLAEEPDPPRVVFVSARDRTAYRHRLAELPARPFLSKSALSVPGLQAIIGG